MERQVELCNEKRSADGKKKCTSQQICNPDSGRCVSRKGKKGKEILEKLKKKSPKRKSPSRKKKSPKRKSPKRKSPKRKSPKRKSPSRKKKSPKRKSPSRKKKSPKRKPRRKKKNCMDHGCPEEKICNPDTGNCVLKRGKKGKEILKRMKGSPKRKSPTPKRKSPTPKRKSPTPKRKSPTPKRKSKQKSKRKSPKFDWSKLKNNCCDQVSEKLESEAKRVIEVKSGEEDYANAQVDIENIDKDSKVYKEITRGCENFDEMVKEFQGKGGTVIWAPEDLSDTNFGIGIEEGDVLVPVCHAGQNRSQIMYAVLCGIKQMMGGKVTVLQAHGAESGFDPFKAYEKLNDENFWGYNCGYHAVKEEMRVQRLKKGEKCPIDRYDDLQREAIGIKKCKRIGHDAAKGKELNPTIFDRGQWMRLERDRKYMRKWFDKNFYSMKTDSDHKRIFIFAFLRAGPIMIRRFLDQKPKSLKGIHIVLVPLGDPIPKAGRIFEEDDLIKKAMVKTFENYSQLVYIKKNGYKSKKAAHKSKRGKSKSGLDSFVKKVNLNGAKIKEINQVINDKNLEIAILMSKLEKERPQFKKDSGNLRLKTDVEFKESLVTDMKKDVAKLEEEMEMRYEEYKRNLELIEILNSDTLPVPKYRKLQYLIKEMKKTDCKQYVQSVLDHVLAKFKRPVRGV